jgi:hypothetical protein
MRFSLPERLAPAAPDQSRYDGDRHAMTRTLGLTLSAGLALVLGELALWRNADLLGLAACIAAAALAAGVLVLRFELLHNTAFPMILASGTMMVTAALGFAGNAAAAYPLFLFCVSLTAFRLLSRQDAHLQVALACAAYALTGASPLGCAAAGAGAWLAGLALATVTDRRRSRALVPAAPIQLRPADESTAPAEHTDLAA